MDSITITIPSIPSEVWATLFTTLVSALYAGCALVTGSLVGRAAQRNTPLKDTADLNRCALGLAGLLWPVVLPVLLVAVLLYGLLLALHGLVFLLGSVSVGLLVRLEKPKAHAPEEAETINVRIAD